MPARISRRASRASGKRRPKGARLVLLQELHGSLYFCQIGRPGQFRSGRIHSRAHHRVLRQPCARTRLVIVASLFETPRRRALPQYCGRARKRRPHGRVYRKMHIPDDPGYYEKFYFTPGDLGFEPGQTSSGLARCAGVLGSVVSGGGAPDGPWRRADADLSRPRSAGAAGDAAEEQAPARRLD